MVSILHSEHPILLEFGNGGFPPVFFINFSRGRLPVSILGMRHLLPVIMLKKQPLPLSLLCAVGRLWILAESLLRSTALIRPSIPSQSVELFVCSPQPCQPRSPTNPPFLCPACSSSSLTLHWATSVRKIIKINKCPGRKKSLGRLWGLLAATLFSSPPLCLVQSQFSSCQ